MIDWLHTLDGLANFGIVIGALVVVVIAAPFVRRHVLRIRDFGMISSGAADGFRIVAGFVAFVMSMSLTQVETAKRNAEDVSTREASAIGGLDRSLFRGGPQFVAVHGDLLVYAHALVDDEWQATGKSDRSTVATAAIMRVADRIMAIKTDGAREETIWSDVNHQLNDVLAQRDARFGVGQIRLPALLYRAILALFGVMLMFAAFAEARLERVVLMAGIMAALGMVFSLVTLLDGPFSGVFRVEPEALRQVIAQMSAR